MVWRPERETEMSKLNCVFILFSLSKVEFAMQLIESIKKETECQKNSSTQVAHKVGRDDRDAHQNIQAAEEDVFSRVSSKMGAYFHQCFWKISFGQC